MLRGLGAIAALASLLVAQPSRSAPSAPPVAIAAGPPFGVSEYLPRLRAAHEIYAYRLLDEGLMYCDSLEGNGPGLGCPAVVRRWQVKDRGWLDSLTYLLSLPEAYNGGEKLCICYPDFALRFQGPNGWVEVIFRLAELGVSIHSPGLPPVRGYYDRIQEQVHALIRRVLQPDMRLDANGLLVGPQPLVPTDRPNLDAPVSYDVAPAPATTPLPVCPDSLWQFCVTDSVQLRLRVSQDGRIRTVQAVAGDSTLVQIATQAVQHWVYRPALRGRIPVPVWINVWVRFRQRP